MVERTGAVLSSIGRASRITQHYPEILVGSTAMPKLSKIFNNRCLVPLQASDCADAVVATAVEEIPEGTQPQPCRNPSSEPEIVNALRARFRDANTLITGTGSTGCRCG
jgi:hypothetical protein